MADVDVAEDLFQLLAGDLRADHGVALQRIGLLDGRYPLERPLHELVVDALLNERAAGAGADFALVEREHHEAFDRLVEEVVVFLAAHRRRRCSAICRPAPASPESGSGWRIA